MFHIHSRVIDELSSPSTSKSQWDVLLDVLLDVCWRGKQDKHPVAMQSLVFIHLYRFIFRKTTTSTIPSPPPTPRTHCSLGIDIYSKHCLDRLVCKSEDESRMTVVASCMTGNYIKSVCSFICYAFVLSRFRTLIDI